MNMNRKDRKFKQTWKLMLVFAALTVWASVPFLSGVSARGGNQISVRTAVLTAPSGNIDPHGSATFKVFDGGGTSLEAEIEDVNAPAGTPLTAFVNGTNIGQIIVGTDGRGRLQLESENGTVPTVNSGSTVEVRNGSTVLVAGIFGAATT